MGVASAAATPADVARATDEQPTAAPFTGYQFLGTDEAGFV